ncbi:hypothetical protein [Nocardioides ferulae]|uniref:hypothetical protein n=1 Tax=Nocardioides ferulae TaxID=2340821 RepID=UPI000F892549|nr:hypothetical protein [Nocardioides ferulae]
MDPEPGARPVAPAASASTPPPPTSLEQRLPCDPGGGFPRRRAGCPDAVPETGWLAGTPDALVLRPFRTLGNDAEGRAWARAHQEEYPFSNDYRDVPDGAARPLVLTRGTVCSGIIRVGYREPLRDHPVTCAELVSVATRRQLSVAVWIVGARVVQVSELYRP